VNDAQLNSPQLAVAKAAAECGKKKWRASRRTLSDAGSGRELLKELCQWRQLWRERQHHTKRGSATEHAAVSERSGESPDGAKRKPIAKRGKQELENARRSVTTQTRQAYLVWSARYRPSTGFGSEALASAKSVLEASELGQEVGVRTNLDVLNAQQHVSFNPPRPVSGAI